MTGKIEQKIEANRIAMEEAEKAKAEAKNLHKAMEDKDKLIEEMKKQLEARSQA
jgi:hypothetical protein